MSGRVVAVLKSVSTDDDGHTSTRLVPVVTFTTLDGRAVTAYCESGLPDPAGSQGLDVTIHYAPDDPAVLGHGPRGVALDMDNAVASTLDFFEGFTANGTTAE
ncbi:DUF3592 domain-containing protein [Streptomyces mirabilis]|uniref:DUF3592 domain-containing protein n=1 Tax=Streptomyces mirabilis TaxID=68239 RepID=UPI00352E785F